jgi:hypothetical protein
LTELKNLVIDGKTGLVTVSWLGSIHHIVNSPMYIIGAHLIDVDAWSLLKTFDDDIYRLNEVAGVVEELADHIYRGKIQYETINREYEVRRDIGILDASGVLAYFFSTGLEYGFRAYEGKGEYHSRIDMWMSLPRFTRCMADELTNNLTDLFLRELADILEEPEIEQIRKEMVSRMVVRSIPVTVYNNDLEFKLLQKPNPASPIYKGYEYITSGRWRLK